MNRDQINALPPSSVSFTGDSHLGVSRSGEGCTDLRKLGCEHLMSSRVAARDSSSTCSTRSTSQEAKVAVMTPMSAMPESISATAMSRPSIVTGYCSP